MADFVLNSAANGQELKRAAVAITVVARDEDDAFGRPGDAAFLLTRRAPKLRAHAGQLALPGGRVDAGETPQQAALRELDEELGLALDESHILGTLDDYPTRSGYLIAPVVLWAPLEAVITPNPAEVAHLFRIPLAELRRPESPEIFSIPESDRPVIRLPTPMVNGHINAPTAAMLYQFREVALEGRATRVDHFDQPVWAWR
ncbi:CoA pyrophosphatase [Vineibacter terrae]|uniref:NUDIX hydrolase n=1 Tax=Vineibacter terrae TaxID=2586908 RepID=UPI002E2FBB0B|nr:CoA pyrophosphatase [Vineibacter terrae]HEX2892050.1 CoA pyrophosphatase [Vineibacter terrae]